MPFLPPTLLDVAGLPRPETPPMDGQSFLPLLTGKSIPWRDHILYEYHWEWNFPATPTMWAIRTQRYKYIFYHGVWDHNGFYDLQTDPHERHNLINVPAYQEQIDQMKNQPNVDLSALVQTIKINLDGGMDDDQLFIWLRSYASVVGISL